ncbi:MAG: hypothetical protein GY754_11955 [bacterium]|nr:hypothetical protein [bacterium]
MKKFRAISAIMALAIFLCNPSLYATESKVVGKINTFCDNIINEFPIPAGYKTTIAITEFDNKSEKARKNKIGFAVSELITERFSKSMKFIVTEKKQVEKIISSLELEQSGLYDSDKVSSVGKLVGARYITVGSVSELAGFYRISLRIITVETGKVVLSKSLELDSALLEEESEKDLPPAYRIYVGGGLKYHLSPADEVNKPGQPIVSVGFYYDMKTVHSLGFRASMYIIPEEEGDNSKNYAETIGSVKKRYYLNDRDVTKQFEFSLGYGYVFHIFKHLSIKPCLYVGYAFINYELIYGLNEYDPPSSTSGTTTIWVRENTTFHDITINPSLDILIAYNMPLSLMISVGYNYGFMKSNASWSYESFNESIELTRPGITLNAGLMFHF